MNAAAPRRMPMSLYARVLVRLWLGYLRLRIARLLLWLLKMLGL
jgi:hypothetical protein